MLFQFTNDVSFNKWLWDDESNKRLLLFSALASLITFAYFKTVYPLPNFMPPDSFSYLEAAHNNQFINLWAIGYSKFLRLISCFSNSHAFLVVLQYILLQLSLHYCLFTVRYLLNPNKWLFAGILTISVMNPLLLHIANFVSSDCLFTTLSLIWFTQLLWITYQPHKKLLLQHAMILLMAFMVRHNAIYYPFISIGLIIFIEMSNRLKWIGICSISVFLLVYIGATQYEYHKKTGTTQYSAFGSWQLAANALYGYAHAKPDSPASVPGRFREIHTIVNAHMKSLNEMPKIFRPDDQIGVYYLWDFKSPLAIYREKKWQHDKNVTYFKKNASVAPLYGQYGRYLILKHPTPFLKYYIWPNFLKFYAPPSGFMGMYNLNRDTINLNAAKWFGWKSNKVYNNLKNNSINVTNIFPVLVGVINTMFILSFCGFVALGGFKKINTFSKRIISLLMATWWCNLFFSVFSAPIELRYQLFPVMITFVCMTLLLGFIFSESRQNNIQLNVNSIPTANELI